MNAKKFLEIEIKKMMYRRAATCHRRLCDVYRLINNDAVLNETQIIELQRLLAEKGKSQEDVLAIATYVNTCH
jgi:hypothetical protein